MTTSFSTGTTAVASEVNQNFTDVLTALNSFDITNCTGTLALARISNLTSTQMAAAFFKDEDDMASNSATAVSSQQALKAYVDGTSTAGYVPTSYAAEESITLPNGLIIKHGLATGLASQIKAITFSAAFPTAVVSVQLTISKTGTGGLPSSAYANNVSVTGITINHAANENCYWMVIGY